MLKTTIFITTFYLLTISPAMAQFSCATELSYTWQKDEKTKSDVPNGRYTASGDTEEKARANLDAKLVDEKPQILKQCREDHEDLSGCVTSKLQNRVGLLSSLGFAGQKNINQSITEHCKAIQGTCLAVANTEYKCVSLAAASEATPTPAEEPTKADKKKK